MSLSWRAASPYLLAGLLGTTSTIHFVSPGVFTDLVPELLPGSQLMWVYASGLAELAVGAAVAAPPTRRLGGFAAAALLLAVFPGNVKMAIDWSDRSVLEQVAAYGRLPIQLPLIWWGYQVGRQAAAES